MEVIISNTQSKTILTEDLEEIISSVLHKAGELYELSADTEVSVLLTDDEYIKKLNKEYRNKNVPTDVLSFALNEGYEMEIIGGSQSILLGDIVISLDTAARQADEYGHSLERELAFLTVHGILHLLGYDHEDEVEREEMRHEEDYVLTIMGITHEQN